MYTTQFYDVVGKEMAPQRDIGSIKLEVTPNTTPPLPLHPIIA